MTYDPETIRPMLLEARGNVRMVAKTLQVDSAELREFVMSTPLLRKALEEVVARGVDMSVGVLFDGLEDDNANVRMQAAKEFLKSRAGQRRGFHHNREMELKVPRSGHLTLTWLPPEERPDPKLIEGKLVEK